VRFLAEMTRASLSRCPERRRQLGLLRSSWAFSLLTWGLLGCEAPRNAGTAVAASTNAEAAVSTNAEAAAPTHAAAAAPRAAASVRDVTPSPPPPDACRVMSISGPAHLGSGRPLTHGERLAGNEAIELDAGSALHFKHTSSGREWTIRGPARLVPCVEGEEEIILALGSLRAELGAGVRPGAEVLVGTPFGSVRYAHAQAELVVSERALELTASAGEVWLEGAESAPELRVSGSIRKKQAERLQPATAVESCARAAADSEKRAESLVSAGESGLGQRAALHVRARKLARARCASATATVLQLAPPSELAAKLRELDGYRRTWRRVPASKT
jgi:hypothetical protein